VISFFNIVSLKHGRSSTVRLPMLLCADTPFTKSRESRRPVSDCCILAKDVDFTLFWQRAGSGPSS
jgi:hypothetical protein